MIKGMIDEIILKLGIKEVLYRTCDMVGCDTHFPHSMAQLQQELPTRLASGEASVLKQYRGNDGLRRLESSLGMR
jgi:3-hydroxyacyl-CoA dehydrogenase